MPIIFIVIARLSTPQLAQILCSPNKLVLDPRFSAPEAVSANPRLASPHPIAPPLAARTHARGTFAAQIPIAEQAARPTERTSRDFVPWRFSAAGRRSAW
jgi:hypothetical protein